MCHNAKTQKAHNSEARTGMFEQRSRNCDIAALNVSVDYDIVDTVTESWQQVKQIQNYEEVAGELLFRKIFELAPAALDMYSFGPEFKGNEQAVYESPRFKRHSTAVVSMLEEAVNMLGPDLEPVLDALTDLGARHVGYGVLPAHYEIVGAALLHTLGAALGDSWTPDVQAGWAMVYGLVSKSMIEGAERQIERKKKLQERRRLAAEKKQKRAASTSHSPTRPPIKDKVRSPRPSRDEKTSRQSRQLSRRQSVAETILRVTGIDILNRAPSKSRDGKDEATVETANSSTGDKSVDTLATTDTPETDSIDSTDHPVPDGKTHSQMVEAVYTTWDIIKRIPNYQEVAGVLLFRKIFEIAPPAMGLFDFTKGLEASEALYSDPAFLTHAKGVVAMLDVAVDMLGPDLDPVTEALEDLGSRHVKYGVIDAHYDVVGEALLKTLEAALGEAWTPSVQEGWTGIYGFVKTAMLRGAAQVSP